MNIFVIGITEGVTALIIYISNGLDNQLILPIKFGMLG